MKTHDTINPVTANRNRLAARGLPALPAGWTLRGEYLTSEDGTERYVMTLSNYGYPEHCRAWELGAKVGELLAALRAVDRADVYVHERPAALAQVRAVLARFPADSEAVGAGQGGAK